MRGKKPESESTHIIAIMMAESKKLVNIHHIHVGKRWRQTHVALAAHTTHNYTNRTGLFFFFFLSDIRSPGTEKAVIC